MAYMQKPGRAPLKNKSFEALTNGTPLRNENDKDKKKKEKKTGEPKVEVKSFDVATGKETTRQVTANSPDAKLAKTLGSTLRFPSADQSKKPEGKAVRQTGTNRNKNATLSTSGVIPESMRGQRFMGKNNKIYIAGARNAPKTGRLLKSN